MAFARNVFVNCPFDDAYLPLLRPLLFVILYVGLTPRIALESLDSGRPRIDKIISLIRDSKYAIHDLSRLQADKAGEYYRLNMPFELGLDVGCRLFRADRYSQKRCLILEAERYRYQAALSDMSNSDIAAHGNDPKEAAREVRNWLANAANLRAPGPTWIWNRFLDFMAASYRQLEAEGYSSRDIEGLPVAELIDRMRTWVERNGSS
jgi:hypothetical protein